ncbi:MAG: alpha-L-fucosidase [Clostridia bacterium]
MNNPNDSYYKWFKAKRGMFIHFGLYSLLGGEYLGKRCNSYCEWIQSFARIPNKILEQIAGGFAPCFDADSIVAFAKTIGCEYIVFTAKHHDGFALFNSFDAFNVCNTPYKKDIIGELARACQKYGVRLGLYYSQFIDWHCPDGGGYLEEKVGCAGSSWDNDWDYPDQSKKNYNICFEQKIMPQIKEIMSNYGQISLAWFDMPLQMTANQSKIIYQTVKKLQPNCLVNSRLGGGSYDYVSLGDNEIPQDLNVNSYDDNAINGLKPSKLGLYECACTLNNTWGYSKFDNNYRTSQQVATLSQKLACLGVNYLINVSPNQDGAIPKEQKEILLKAFCK